jgi:hypothetical protein
MFAGRHLQGIGNGIKAFKVLLKASADLFFLLNQGIVDPEIFAMAVVNRRWNGHDDGQMTIQENGRFGCAEKGLF